MKKASKKDYPPALHKGKNPDNKHSDVDTGKDESDILNLTNFKILFENSPVGNSITSIDGILHVNKAFCDILGYTEDELKTKNMLDITHPDDRKLSADYMKMLVSRKVSQGRFDKRYLHKNGKIVWVDVTTCTHYSTDGKPLFFMTTIIDITEKKNAEKILQKQENELQIILDSISAWIFYKDTENRLIRVNKAYADIMGVTKKELEGKSLFDMFPKEQAEAYWKDDLEVINSGVPKLNFIESMESPDGLLWAQTSKVPYRDTDGNITGVIGFTINITEQILAEEQLQKSKQELERFLNLVPDMVCIASTEGYFLSVNEAWSEILGFSKEELLAVPFTWFIHPADLDYTLKEIEKQQEGLNTFNFINRYKCVDGSYKLLEWVATPAVDGLLYAAARDITDRKKAEDALRESMEFNKSILQSIPFGIDIVDESGNILFQNEILENIFGKQAVGEKCWLLYRDDKKQCPGCPLQTKISIGETKLYETQGVLGNKTFLISHTGMMFHGTKAILEVFQDITERKLAEEKLRDLNQQLQDLNATKDKLFSIIAHDIKNPLNSILGFSDLLLNNLKLYETEKSLVFTDHIHQASKQTLNLLNNLLAWSKIQTGNIQFNPENIFLQPIVTEIIEISKAPAKLKNITIESTITDKMLVYADQYMLQTILRNLVSNAVKFTKSGGVVQISYTFNKNYAEIVIEDNGIGMNEAILGKLFKIDSNITTKGTASEKGSGLGLILCKELIEKHGGKIWVESIPDTGSKFHFTLPHHVLESNNLQIILS